MQRRKVWLGLAVIPLVVLGAFAAAALGGFGGDADPPEDTAIRDRAPLSESAPETIAPLDAAIVAGTTGSGSGAGMCGSTLSVHSYLVEIGLLDEEDLADLPVPYDFHEDGYWTIDPLGPDGAWAVGESLTDAVWLCQLTASPELAAALLRIEEGDDITIEELVAIVEGDPGAVTDPDDSSSGENTVETLSPKQLQQRVRDLMDVAAVAEGLGNIDTAGSLLDEAKDLYGAYGEIVVNSAEFPQELTAVVAAAELLGLDELVGEAQAKISELLEKELADGAELFSPCTQDVDLIRVYRSAVERYLEWHGGTDGLWNAWRDVQDRRRLDDPIPECEGGVWVASLPLEGGWDGMVDVHLESCGFARWEGRMTANGTLAADGATMTLTSDVPIEFNLLDAATATTFRTQWEFGRPGSKTIDVEVVVLVSLVTPDATGEGGTSMRSDGIFEMDRFARSATLTLHFAPSTFEMVIEANGMKFRNSREINWEKKVFEAEIEQRDDLCKGN